MTLPENSVLFVNIGVIALLVISIIIGYIKGVFLQIINTIGLIASILISWMIAPGLSGLIKIIPENWAPFRSTALAGIFYDKINTLCWFLIVFLVCMIVLAVIRPIFKVVTELPVIKSVDKTLGVVFSIIPAFLLICLVTFFLNTALFTNGKEVVDNSVLQYTDDVADKVTEVLSSSFKENVAIQKMISNPLSLEDGDIESIIQWLSNCQVSSEDIYNFLKNYGIDTNKLNELIKTLEDK